MNEHHRRGIVFRVLRNAFSCRASKICIAEGSEATRGTNYNFTVYGGFRCRVQIKM
jgi:hypothetical protein